MTTDFATILPPNATALERAVERATARDDTIVVPIETLVDPATIAIELLPWLAWGFSVDTWDADWSEAAKRAAVAASIDLHRRKGTRASVESILSRFDELLTLVEWHETTPRGTPHTFEIRLPIATGAAGVGGRRATAAFADAIIREVRRVKPVREHFRLVQMIEAAAAIGIQGVGRMVGSLRLPAAATFDASPDWAAYLQTEDGEPLQDSAGSFWDTRP